MRKIIKSPLAALFLAVVLLCQVQTVSMAAKRKNSIKLYEDEYKNLLMMIEKSVKLPLDEFNNLLARIREVETERERKKKEQERLRGMAAYSKYNFTGGKMNCLVDENGASIGLTLSLSLTRKGWKEINIESIPNLKEVTLDGKTSPVERKNDRKISIITDKTGKSTLKINYHPKIVREKRRSNIYNYFMIDLNQRTPVDVNLTLPPGVSPTPDMRSRHTFKRAGNRWTTSFRTNFTRPVRVEWFVPRKDGVVRKDPSYSATTESYFLFDSSLVKYVALVNLEIFGDISEPVPFVLPEGFTLVDSEVPEGVKVRAEGESGNEIRAYLPQSTGDTAQFIIYAERQFRGDALSVSPLMCKQAKRSVGMVAMSSRERRINLKTGAAMEEIDTRLISGTLMALGETEPEKLLKFSVSGYEINPFELRLEKENRADSIDAYVREASYYASLNSDGIFMIEGSISLINNNRQFLAVDLPEGASIQSAFVDSGGVKPVTDDTGNILIPIRPKKHSLDGLVKVEFVFTMIGKKMGEEGIRRIELPTLDIPANRTDLHLFLPKGYEYEDFYGSLESGKPAFTRTSYISRKEKEAMELARKRAEEEKRLEASDYNDVLSIPAGTTTESTRTKTYEPKKARQPNVYGADDKDNTYLVDGISTTDAKTQTWSNEFDVISDVSGKAGASYDETTISGARSLKIKIPKQGILYRFYNMLNSGEPLYIKFEYEEE